MTGRNDPCPCGSGKRYKHCHGGGESPDAMAKQGVEAHRRNDLAAAERLYRQRWRWRPTTRSLCTIWGSRSTSKSAWTKLCRCSTALPRSSRGARIPQQSRPRAGRVVARYGCDSRLPARPRAQPAACRRLEQSGPRAQATGDVDGAIDAFRNGLASRPTSRSCTGISRSRCCSVGDYARAWREYEWRLRTPELARSLRIRRARDGTAKTRQARRILVTAEQGLGDTIQFLRFASPLADRGARVIVAVPRRLRQLASTVPRRRACDRARRSAPRLRRVRPVDVAAARSGHRARRGLRSTSPTCARHRCRLHADAIERRHRVGRRARQHARTRGAALRWRSSHRSSTFLASAVLAQA